MNPVTTSCLRRVNGKDHRITLPSFRRIVLVLILLVLFSSSFSTTQAWAQRNRDDDVSWYKEFVDAIGGTLYFVAWPTATYERVSFEGLSRTYGGVDIKIKLHGRSAFDDSSLWTEVVVEVRGGEVTDIKWGRNNAIIAQPGETMGAIVELLAELNKEYDRTNGTTRNPRPREPYRPPVSQRTYAICLTNTTDLDLNYQFRWGAGEWENRRVAPNGSRWHSLKVSDGSGIPPKIQIKYDFALSDEDRRQSRTLTSKAVPLPVECSDAQGYTFVSKGQVLGLKSDKWQPGWPHPFFSGVITSRDEGQWKPAEGYRWYDPNDGGNLQTIKKDVGVVGMSVKNVESSAFPVVAKVVERGSAADEGVRAGLEIVAVGGQSTMRMSSSDCVALIKGPIGSTVLVKFREPTTGRQFGVHLERR